MKSHIYFDMKTFQGFLTERKIIEQSALKDYLNSRGMLDDYRTHKKSLKQVEAPPPMASGWQLDGEEAVQVTNEILNSILQQTVKETWF